MEFSSRFSCVGYDGSKIKIYGNYILGFLRFVLIDESIFWLDYVDGEVYKLVENNVIVVFELYLFKILFVICMRL